MQIPALTYFLATGIKMKKTVKTQNSNKPADDTHDGLMRKLHYLDEHIATLAADRNATVELIKSKFDKTDENIKFELSKLRKD